MLKTLLRTSLLIAPLLSAELLIASNPEAEQPIKKLTALDLVVYKKPVDTTSATNTTVGQMGYSHIGKLPYDLSKSLVSNKYLPRQDALSMARVSKFWHRVSSVMNLSKKEYDVSPSCDNLSKLHLSDVLALFSLTAKDIPLRVVDYSPLDPSLAAQPAPAEMPAHVQAFVEGVAANRQLSILLARRTLGMDPGIHFREVLLMAAIVGKSKLLKDYLRDLYKEYNDAYLVTHKVDLWGDKEHGRVLLNNSAEIKRVLMSLKLIALNPVPGDAAHEHLELLCAFARLHSKISCTSYLEEVVLKQPDQPYWACYTDNPSTIADYPYMCDVLNNESEGHVGLEKAPAFADYARALFPGNRSIDLVKLYSARLSRSLCLGNIEEAMQFEAEMLKEFNPDNILNYTDTWHSILAPEKFQLILNQDQGVWGRYNQMIELTDKLFAKAEQDGGPTPMQRAALKRLKAEAIINFRDQARFSRLDDLLEDLTQAFSASPDATLEVEFEFEDIIDPLTFLRAKNQKLLCAAALLQERWDEASQYVQTFKGFCPGLLIAMKTKMDEPNFPKALVAPLGKILTHGWKDAKKEGISKSLGVQAFFKHIHDDAFVNKFLAGHPIVKGWVKKMLADKTSK